MKNLLLLTLITITNLPTFQLTPEGFEKPYVIIEHEGSKEQLYKKTLIFLNTYYASPKSAISNIENETITINGFAANAIRRNSMHVFDMDYTIVLRFKNGKIRMDAPTFSLTAFYGKRQTLHLNHDKTSLDGANLGIYKNGKLKSKKAKADLEEFFNKFIIDLNKGLTPEDW